MDMHTKLPQRWPKIVVAIVIGSLITYAPTCLQVLSSLSMKNTDHSACIDIMNIDYCIVGNFDGGNIDDSSKFSLSIFFNCMANTGCLRDYSSIFPHQFLNEANLNIFPQNFSAIWYDIILQCNQLGSTLHYVGQ